MSSPRRRGARSGWLAGALLALAACGGEPPGGAGPAAAPAAAETLETPYTAEQIRDAWRPGLTLVMHYAFPDRQEWQRWTVVAADPDGAVIEYLPLDAQGEPAAPPQRARSGWIELRDHALFPAAEARRERASRQSALGELEGWHYRVHDPRAETMSEFFFADRLPGAPLWMETRSGGELLLTVNQIARQQLPGPPAGDPGTPPGPG